MSGLGGRFDCGTKEHHPSAQGDWVESNNTMDVRIYVGNLNKSTTQDEIKTLFIQAGVVTSVEIAKDKALACQKASPL